MIKQSEYERELKYLCTKIKKSFEKKLNLINASNIKHCINDFIKLNKKTKNQYIDELVYAIGRTNIEYKKYSQENESFMDYRIEKKIKKAYIKLSKIAMNEKIKRINENKHGEDMQIQYNSDRGSYIVNSFKAGNIISSKEYQIDNVKHLGSKRAEVLKRLKSLNFGINIFDELDIDKENFYKINPDIVHILLCEGKVNYAKMYIKEVAGGYPLHKPFKIKYELNKNLKEGKFSKEENKNMKIMAKQDRISNDISFFRHKRNKKISKLQSANEIKHYVRTNEITKNDNCDTTMEIRKKIKLNVYKQTGNIYPEVSVKTSPIIQQTNKRLRNLVNVNTGEKVANGNCKIDEEINPKVKNLINTKSGDVIAYAKLKDRSKIKRKDTFKSFVNTNTGKIVAYGER